PFPRRRPTPATLQGTTTPVNPRTHSCRMYASTRHRRVPHATQSRTAGPTWDRLIGGIARERMAHAARQLPRGRVAGVVVVVQDLCGRPVHESHGVTERSMTTRSSTAD